MKQLRPFTIAWILISIFLFVEYLTLHRIIPRHSLIQMFACRILKHCSPLSTKAGQPLSYWLGWMGFSVICLTNLYILRKHWRPLKNFGDSAVFLNWHIFFGMLGPTLIVFHTNFRVNGLVAISFWSMMVSAISGVVGRYFYMQILEKKSVMLSHIKEHEHYFAKYPNNRPHVTKELVKASFDEVFRKAGGLSKKDLLNSSLTYIFLHSLLGSFRMQFALPRLSWSKSLGTRVKMRDWAILSKQLLALEYMKRLFGYWKAFHSPFAFFMYVVAIIHIISSLIFKIPTSR